MDLIAEPEMIAEMFEKATDLMIDTVKHMISIDCKPDAIWLAEDMGCTRSTLFSHKVYRELLWPCHKNWETFSTKTVFISSCIPAV